MSVQTGRIFDIKEFSVHDGPGAGMTVFLKGCPLRCVWCHNPEGQRFETELMHKASLCTGCGACATPTDSASYSAFGRAVEVCPQGALSVCGRDVTAEELLDRILPLAPILRMLGGGVTFSGGEPLMQWEFVCQAADLLHRHGLPVYLETCGYADEDAFWQTVKRMDHVMMDLKLMDDGAHRQYTGVSNLQILRNARRLMGSDISFVFRTPMIPGITDTEENRESIRDFVGEYAWECLPYNALAGAKYAMLGREYLYEKGELR